ncbi:MAG: DUF4349 domain-containing protein [Saprospirales bacterium]|nr:DUF4349 domain-containing protein [Saprospirales bacterium]
MKRYVFLSPACLLLLITAVFSCRQNEQSPSAIEPDSEDAVPLAPGRQAAPPPVSSYVFHSAAAESTRWDAVKKLVRTAELRFRTADVLQATLGIEDVVQQNGGFVLEDDLTQNREQYHLTPVGSDSSLETSVFALQCRLVFRIPYAQLDTTLRAIAPWAELLDYRRIHVVDETLNALEKRLAELRNRQYQGQIEAATAQGGKLPSVTEAIDKSFGGRAAADAARLEQLRLDDAVQLSTVEIEIYQRPVVRREMVVNLEDVTSPQAGFGNQLAEALAGGWRGLQALLLFIARLWSVLLIGAVIGVAVWRWRKASGSN